MSVLDTLKAATPARKSVRMCVDGALQAEHDALRDGIGDAAAADERAASLAFTETSRVIDEMDALRERIAASEVTFVFERIPWTERVALQAAHPPRDDNMIDRFRGYNTETFSDAIVRQSCVSVTGAGGDTETDIPGEVWDSLLGGEDIKGSLNFNQVNELVAAANSVNDSETRVPHSARSWLTSQDYGTSLAQPSPGTSPQSASKAGSRPTSRKSSATKKAASSGS